MFVPFSLGARLQKCADFVRQGVKLADIGTDHGYLGIWLLKTGRVTAALGADINQGPLATAAANGAKYGVDLQTRLSNGFDALLPQEVEDAVLAGMGGELIATLIGATPWLKNDTKQLILQPMSGADKLRRFLHAKGFALLQEEVVLENGKLYTVMLVRFAPTALAPLRPYMGAVVPHSPHSASYAAHVVQGLQNRLKGLKGQEKQELHTAIAALQKEYLHV